MYWINIKTMRKYNELKNSSFYSTDSRLCKYKKYITLIDDIFQKSPTTPEQTILYRGIQNDYIDNTYYPFKDALLQNIGNDVCFQTFLSTSYNRDSALFFSDGILLELTVQIGTKFIPIDYWLGNTENGSEDEILLPQNLLFHIESVENIIINNKEYSIFHCYHIGSVLTSKYNITK